MLKFGNTGTVPYVLGAHDLVEMFQNSCYMRGDIVFELLPIRISEIFSNS